MTPPSFPSPRPTASRKATGSARSAPRTPPGTSRGAGPRRTSPRPRPPWRPASRRRAGSAPRFGARRPCATASRRPGRLGELGHAEGLAVAAEDVGRDGLVGPRREAVLALEPPEQVLRESRVVPVADPVVPRVGGVGLGYLPGLEPRLHLPLPRLPAVALELQRRDGLERQGAQVIPLM